MGQPEWQRLGGDSWAFGVKVRGLVRHRLAEVYFDEGAEGREGGWRWRAIGEFNATQAQGKSFTLAEAVEQCEKVLGIK